MNNIYISVRTKLIISCIFSVLWFSFSIWIGQAWLHQLAEIINFIPALLVVSGIAFIPGLANAFIVSSLLFDKRPIFKTLETYPDLTILIAAYNEESCIEETIESISRQEYAGHVTVIVSDDGSSDGTTYEVANAQVKYETDSLTINCHEMVQNVGKANALNAVLKQVTTDYCITIDADTYLYKDALKNIVLNIVNGPPNTAAVAGVVLVRNSRVNWLTKIQEWDYFHGIAVVKRIQSLYQGTLVAQGAFSIYTTASLREAGGWLDTVGEDIVLTWALRDKGHRVSYSETAISFTNVPENYPQFFGQRKRWSRGLIEAFKTYPKSITTMSMTTPFIWFNLMFPFIDTIFLTAFVPGVIGAIFFQWYAIVGLMTLILLPMSLGMNWLIYRKHTKTFREMGLTVRKNRLGFLIFILTYQFIMVPACVAGYVAEIFNFKKTWGTK